MLPGCRFLNTTVGRYSTSFIHEGTRNTRLQDGPKKKENEEEREGKKNEWKWVLESINLKT